MQASKDVLAMAALEVDLSKVEMGQTVTVKWRGKPVFVRRRTETEIDGARAVDLGQLRDPERDEDRAKNPEVRICRAPGVLDDELLTPSCNHVYCGCVCLYPLCSVAP